MRFSFGLVTMLFTLTTLKIWSVPSGE